MDAIERWAAIHEAIMVSSRRTRHISDQQRSCGSLGDPPAMCLPVTRRTGPAPVVLDDVRQGAPTMIGSSSPRLRE
jgi:hypothetical protein